MFNQMEVEKIQQIISEIIANELHVSVADISQNSTFYELGLDSVNSIFLLSEMETRLEIDVDPMSVYDNPTVSSFSHYLHSLLT